MTLAPPGNQLVLPSWPWPPPTPLESHRLVHNQWACSPFSAPSSKSHFTGLPLSLLCPISLGYCCRCCVPFHWATVVAELSHFCAIVVAVVSHFCATVVAVVSHLCAAVVAVVSHFTVLLLSLLCPILLGYCCRCCVPFHCATVVAAVSHFTGLLLSLLCPISLGYCSRCGVPFLC